MTPAPPRAPVRRLSFLPAGGDRVASSRIRVYGLQGALAAMQVESRIGYWPDAEALVVQKRVTGEVLAAVRDFKGRGGLVLYDCDDLGKPLDYWAPPEALKEMLALADVVTTNTGPFRDALLQHPGVPLVEIVPDVIDYGLQAPVRNDALAASPLRILWFGNHTNLHLLGRYARALEMVPDCTVVICTSKDVDLSPFGRGPFAFFQWDLAGFPDLLRSCHLSFLPHDGGAADRAKSNNRMITSIGWGVPAVVSRTPEYEKLAHLAGLPESIFGSPEEVAGAIEFLRPQAARSRYLDLAQPAVWGRHAPDVVARRFCDVVARHIERIEGVSR